MEKQHDLNNEISAIHGALDALELPHTTRKAASNLLHALSLIATSRAKEYGDFLDNCDIAASYANVSNMDVANVLIGVKKARLNYNPSHEDSWADMIAYTALRSAMIDDQGCEG